MGYPSLSNVRHPSIWRMMLLATVSWGGPGFLAWIGGHATMLVDRQNDSEPIGSSGNETSARKLFPPAFGYKRWKKKFIFSPPQSDLSKACLLLPKYFLQY